MKRTEELIGLILWGLHMKPLVQKTASYYSPFECVILLPYAVVVCTY